MFMFLIVGFIISLSAPETVPCVPSPGFCIAVTLAISAAALPVGLLLSGFVRRIARRKPPRDKAVVVYRGLLFYHLCLLAGFAASLYVFGWRHAALVICSGWQSDVLVEGVSVAPFLLSVVLSWVPGYLMGSVLRSSPGGVWRHVIFQAKGCALTAIPFFTFLLLFDLAGFLPERLQAFLHIYPFLQWISTGAVLVVMFALAPLLLKVLWASRPMPAGPERGRLERFCSGLGFKCRDILVWNTDGGLVNAGMTGIVASLRYILITDAMLMKLTPDEVEAVLGHEIGHAAHMHIPWYALLAVGYMCLMVTVWELPVTGPVEGTRTMMATFSFVSYWVVLFGFVSRRFERQADLYGARAVGDFSLMEGALEKVAELNGHIHKVFSWRHFSMEKRIRFLRRAAADPSTAARFEKRLGIVLAALVVAVLLGLVGFSRVALRQISDPSGRLASVAEALAKEGDYAGALEYARRAVDSSAAGNAYHHALFGRCLLGTGDRSGALAEFRTALHLADSSGRLRRYLVGIIEELSPKDS